MIEQAILRNAIAEKTVRKILLKNDDLLICNRINLELIILILKTAKIQQLYLYSNFRVNLNETMLVHTQPLMLKTPAHSVQ